MSPSCTLFMSCQSQTGFRLPGFIAWLGHCLRQLTLLQYRGALGSCDDKHLFLTVWRLGASGVGSDESTLAPSLLLCLRQWRQGAGSSSSRCEGGWAAQGCYSRRREGRVGAVRPSLLESLGGRASQSSPGLSPTPCSREGPGLPRKYPPDSGQHLLLASEPLGLSRTYCHIWTSQEGGLGLMG